MFQSSCRLLTPTDRHRTMFSHFRVSPGPHDVPLGFFSKKKENVFNSCQHTLKGALSRRFYCILVKAAQIFDTEPFFLKAGFHMIADRRSQIAIRSAIVCDHMETTSAIVCDPAIVIAEDRTMFYLKAGFHMIADRRSQTIAINRRRSQEIEHGSIFCDRLRSRSQDRRRSQK